MDALQRIESNDHLLTEILVLLPAKSVFRFTCVSKRWKHIIDNPFFRQSYTKRHRSGGRLLALIDYNMYRNRLNILPICTDHEAMNQRSIELERTSYNGKFIDSSNGLILFCSDNTATAIYHVVNLVAKKTVSLPPPPAPPASYYNNTSVGFKCEENTSELKANYIVIRAFQYDYDAIIILQIQTYSSKTGKWVVSTLQASITSNFLLYGDPPMVANGVFHWFAELSTSLNIQHPSLVVYNTKDDNHNNLQLIHLPVIRWMRSFRWMRTSADDILWFFGIKSDNIKVWMLPKGEDGSYRRATTIPEEEWVLIYNISVGSILRALNIQDCTNFVFEAMVSWDPLVVLVRVDWVLLFSYNMESKSGVMVRYNGSLVLTEGLYPYMESSSLSPYAL